MMCIKTSGLPKNGSEALSPPEFSRATRPGGQPRMRGGGAAVPAGLRTEEVEASRRAHGENKLSRRPGRGFWRCFLSGLGDPVIRILLGALAINVLFMFRKSDWVETLGIAVSVLLATTISALSEVGSQSAFDRLREQSAEGHCRVRRDGTVVEIPWDEVVVGDILLLGAGENIPADGVLLRGELTLDQAAMTGESREVRKQAGGRDEGDPSDEVSVFRGCAILAGEGVMRVRAVGDATVLGGISQEIQSQTRESPLKLRLAKLAGQISVLGYVAAALVAAAFLFHAFVIGSGWNAEVIRLKLTDLPYVLNTLLHALMLGLTVIVVAVPEGLPMMIAVVLSANIRRMVRDRVLVRTAVGIEAAGSMDLLFTDKTGTLTDGKLSVGAVLTGNGTVYRDIGAFRRAGQARFAAYRSSCRYNTASLVGKDPAARDREDAPSVAIGGNATDRALLRSILIPGEAGEDGQAMVGGRVPFDSAHKFSAATVRLHEAGLPSCLTFVKGAPEILLPHVRCAYDGDGRTIAVDRWRFDRQLRKWTSEGERVLLLAASEEALSPSAMARGEFGELILICAVALADRIRPEARGAVEALHGAGVQVVMITGDSKETATHIARTCGILTPDVDLVLTGQELAALSDFRLRELLPRLAVVSRALPTDKSRLVRVAQEENRVVGMTGDGINDAPALRRADVGFAMGSGAAVAQDAGDIVILDDNLASIVRAVLYGRNIFKSIRKFITLQLTMNFCAVAVSMIGPFIGVDAPVTVVQMLWINLIMDTLGGLAFAGEAAMPSCLAERPKRRDEPILCRYMVNEIIFLGGYTVALCLLFLKSPWIRAAYRASEGDLCHLTAFFALFIFSSVFNCFNARSDRLRPCAGLGGNRPFIFIMTAILAVQIVFVYLGGSVLRTVPLTGRELALTALLALTVLPAEKIRKLIWRARRHREKY